jgi:cardiolipin synthase
VKKYIPNALTALRLLFVPFIGYFIYSEKYVIAVAFFAIGGFTDILDGYIARRYSLVTKWGKFFDPLADKLMQVTALTFLVIQSFIPIFVLVIVVIKELLMLIGGILVYKRGKTVIGANWCGKLASVIFYFAIIATIILGFDRFKNSYTAIATKILMVLAVACTLFALVMYIIVYFRFTKDYDKNNSITE